MSEPFRYRVIDDQDMVTERLRRVRALELDHFGTGLRAEELGGLDGELVRERMELQRRIEVHAELLWPEQPPAQQPPADPAPEPGDVDQGGEHEGGAIGGPTAPVGPVPQQDPPSPAPMGSAPALDTSSPVGPLVHHRVTDEPDAAPDAAPTDAGLAGTALDPAVEPGMDFETAAGRHRDGDTEGVDRALPERAGPFDRVGGYPAAN